MLMVGEGMRAGGRGRLTLVGTVRVTQARPTGMSGTVSVMRTTPGEGANAWRGYSSSLSYAESELSWWCCMITGMLDGGMEASELSGER